MEDIQIAMAGQGHIDGIEAIEKLSFTIPWSRQSITEEILENDIAVYICAMTGEKVVGYAGMWQICDEGHITNIAVHPEFRSSGVGSALLKAILEIAEERGIVSLTLEVRRSNQVAQGLYKKFGFEEGGMRKAYYADDNEDAVIMWKHFR